MVTRRTIALVVFPAAVTILGIAAATLGRHGGRPENAASVPGVPEQLPSVLTWFLAAVIVVGTVVTLYVATVQLGVRIMGRIALSVLLVVALIGGIFGAIELLGYEPAEDEQDDEEMTLREAVFHPVETSNELTEDVKQSAERGQFQSIALIGMTIVVLGTLGIVLTVAFLARDHVSVPDTVADAISEETPEDPTHGDQRLEAVGNAAGRAADRVDDDDLENAVFRAWGEMTDALEIDTPETTTPEEFADIAVGAGMDRADVRELTELFEEVRYGEATVTEDRSQRAMAALRRIEEAYAGGTHE